jgi:hypothetical protein
LFHVNAIEDRPLRARWRAVARELEPDFMLQESSQTMHFFSEPYLRKLFQEWGKLRLGPIEITHRETGEKFKQVGGASHIVDPHRTSTQPKRHRPQTREWTRSSLRFWRQGL